MINTSKNKVLHTFTLIFGFKLLSCFIIHLKTAHIYLFIPETTGQNYKKKIKKHIYYQNPGVTVKRLIKYKI